MKDVFLALSMSLDGYVAGLKDNVEPPHRWLFSGDTTSHHEGLRHVGMSTASASRDIVDDYFDHTGACVVGRTTFELSDPPGRPAAVPDAVLHRLP
jgi:hypothetical protein